MQDRQAEYDTLKRMVIRVPEGDPEEPPLKYMVNHIQSFLASEYMVEVAPGEYKYTAAGIAHIMANSTDQF